VYVVPFHGYELQEVCVALPFVELALIVKFRVAVLTQLAAFNEVNV
jgi:hypothetical protein